MSEDTLKRKQLIRRNVQQQRDALPPAQRASKSSAVTDRLLTIPAVAAAETFFIYLSFRSEVETRDIICALLQQGRTIAVPVTGMCEKRILPVLLKSLDGLVPGPMGILQPAPDCMHPVEPEWIDIVIAPGIAFSENGSRIGYGGGFYDRFLRQHNKTAYALAFELQLLEQIPFDPEHDARVDYIVTEKRLIDCKNSRL